MGPVRKMKRLRFAVDEPRGAERGRQAAQTESAVNRVLDSRPQVIGTTYVHAPPAWLLTACRSAVGSMGLVLFILTWRSWAGMPLAARTLSLVLAPTLVAASIWPRPWNRMVKFIADERGVYFPANELLILSFRQATHQTWLHVPWKNISNLRIDREAGEDGRCVAFDVVATSGEAEAFFKHVGRPRVSSTGRAMPLSVAYADSPPQPAKTIQLLLSLKALNEA